MKGCFKWAAIVVAVVAAIVSLYFWNHAREISRILAHSREVEKQTKYQGESFPVSINFPSGPARKTSVWAEPWKGMPREVATCPDDSEGAEYAELYQLTDAGPLLKEPFADATHPAVSSTMQSCYQVPLEPVFSRRLIVSETEAAGWRLRTTLLPTPHGGVVVPKDLPPEIAARLAEGSEPPPEPTRFKATADPRFTSSSGRFSKGKSLSDLQREADARADRQYSQAKDRYDKMHHHFYLVEAVRDFAGGRVLILRRFGLVYGTETVQDAEATIRLMTTEVVGPPEASINSKPL